jgi:hypothetical protein
VVGADYRLQERGNIGSSMVTSKPLGKEEDWIFKKVKFVEDYTTKQRS